MAQSFSCLIAIILVTTLRVHDCQEGVVLGCLSVYLQVSIITLKSGNQWCSANIFT